jgi:hypothetical protein
MHAPPLFSSHSRAGTGQPKEKVACYPTGVGGYISTCHARQVIVDTSNEIGGDGDVPHPAIGGARRMQVPDPSQQHRVMVRAHSTACTAAQPSDTPVMACGPTCKASSSLAYCLPLLDRQGACDREHQ